jgi:tetratricopeptide (TPR) repeat protein
MQDPSAQSWVSLIGGLYRIGRGDWERAVELLRRAADSYAAIGLLRRQEESLHHLGWAQVGAGDLAASRSTYDALDELARRTGDFQARSWALCGKAEADLREGRQPEGLEEAIAEAQRCGDILEEGKAAGLAALWKLREGDREAALSQLGSLLDLASGMRLSFFHGGFDLAVEAVRGLLPDPRVVPLAQRLARNLHLLSLSQPIAEPSLHRLRAMLAEHTGNRSLASREWERARSAARRLRMPLAEKLAER